MKLRLPQRRIWRAAIYLGSLLLIGVAFDLILVEMRRKITPGFDTTRIMGPLSPDGSIDYLAAVEQHFGRGVTPENNAAVLLVQALGRQGLPANQPRDGITGRLGMPPVPDKGEYFQKYEEYCTAHSVPSEADPTDPQTSTTQPTLPSASTLAWIKSSEVPLALITEASKRSRFFMPFDGGTRLQTMVEILLPYLSQVGGVRRALLTRAAVRLEAGDFAAFHEDVATVHRLARLLGQAATLIDRAVARDLETAACRAEQLAIASGKLTPGQMRTMAAELAAMPDLPNFAEAVDQGERYMILDILQSAARVGPSQPLLLDVLSTIGSQRTFFADAAYRFWPVPYEQSMRIMNGLYDGVLVSVRLPTYAERQEALILWEKQIGRIHQRSYIPKMLSAEWPAEAFMPSLLRMVRRDENARAERRLSQIALALAIYKAEQGAYPATLLELTPSVLPVVPVDPFSEKAFIYARTGAGYTLYSVGANMTDDGGKDEQGGDDVLASMP